MNDLEKKKYLQDYLKELSTFIDNSNIITQKLHIAYTERLNKISSSEKISVRPITESINQLKTLSDSIKETVNVLKKDFSI